MSSVVTENDGKFRLEPNDLDADELLHWTDPEGDYFLPMDHSIKVFWAMAN
jgi:hypothetical protein